MSLAGGGTALQDCGAEFKPARSVVSVTVVSRLKYFLNHTKGDPAVSEQLSGVHREGAGAGACALVLFQLPACTSCEFCPLGSPKQMGT